MTRNGDQLPEEAGWKPRRVMALPGPVLCLCLLAAGAAPAKADDSGILNLNFENDIFYDRDRNYTNGVRASWLAATSDTPHWMLESARLFPFFAQGGTVRASYAIGQNMYTPRDITTDTPSTADRPYAGWLYGSAGVIAETGERLDQIGLTLGMVGPASLAEETQKLIHSIVGSDRPEGWHTQLRNEPGIILTYQRSWRRLVSETLFLNMPFEVTPHVGGALGNVFTYANAGVTVRIGDSLPLDYGPPRIQPSLPGSEYFAPAGSFGWYLFAGLDGRAVARNIFLDGNSFRESRSVGKKHLVGDIQIGAAIIWQGMRFSYTHVFRSQEFDGQVGSDNFGALSLSVRY